MPKAVKAIDCQIKASKSVHVLRANINSEGPRSAPAVVCPRNGANRKRTRVHIESIGRAVSHQINVPTVCQGGERDGGGGATRQVDLHVGIRPSEPGDAGIPCSQVKVVRVCFSLLK